MKKDNKAVLINYNQAYFTAFDPFILSWEWWSSNSERYSNIFEIEMLTI